MINAPSSRPDQRLGQARKFAADDAAAAEFNDLSLTCGCALFPAGRAVSDSITE